MDFGVAIGLGCFLALVAAIVICAILLPKNKEGQFGGFAKFLRDYFLLRYLMVEAILRFFFVVNTCACFFVGFFLLFSKIDTGWNSTSLAPAGIAIIILGPFVTRISYELTMIAIMQLKNTMEINAKIKGDAGSATNLFNVPTNGFVSNIANSVAQAAQAQPQQPQQMYNSPVQQPQQQAPVAPVAPEAPAAPAEVVCPNCGASVVADATFCDKCGTKLN